MKNETDALPAIGGLVPHSGAMLLLDRLVAVGADYLQAEVVITKQSLFAGPQGVGSWVGIEYMAQAVAAFAGYGDTDANLETAATARSAWQPQPPKIGFLLGTRHYNAHCGHFAIGSTLLIHAQRLFVADNGLGSFDCHIEQHGQRLADAILTVFQPSDAAQFLAGGPI